jgi:hypothetical protein
MTAVFTLAASLMLGAITATAHHSPSAFDLKASMVKKGVLTKVDWTNPHIQLHLDVKGADGSVTAWTFEGHPPAWFLKAGMRKIDFQKGVGQEVTIDGYPPKDSSSTFGYFTGIVFKDGSKLRFDNGAINQ